MRTALRPLVALAALVLLPCPAPAANPEPIVLFVDGQRREVLPVLKGGAELIPVDIVIAGTGVRSRADAARGTLTLTHQGRELVFYAGKSLASLDGDLRLLPAPVQSEGGAFLVPVDAVPRLIAPLLGRPGEWRAASRVLVLGGVAAPRIKVTTLVAGDSVRVVLEASEKVPYRVRQEPGRVTVAVARELVDVAFTQERLTGGIVDLVQFQGGRENLFAVTLGRRFHQLQHSEQDSRLVLEFQAQPLPMRAAATPQAAPSSEAAPAPPAAPRTVVIDPGHGGAEVGAKGPGGAFEKDVTLGIARKLRAAIVNGLGYRVFLTREGDQELDLDQRPAIANNYKADLFVSIHANASRSHGASGSEVYFLSYQASDDESRRLAMIEGGEIAPGSPAPPGSELSLILWDMAQAEHLEESSALASRIQEELASVTGSQGRGIKQAPFRVLVGAAMPAVLIEVAFISHPEEEKLLVSEAYQGRVAAALLRGLARYESERAQRAASPSASRPGS